jgi:2,3-bisphosphoglycerate-independent phosphoglycerate mutase
MAPRRVCLIFVDGLGWGDDDPAVNPCRDYGGERLRLPSRPGAGVVPHAGGWARPLDAALGIAGLPQSATGQTSLLCGVNAQAVLGQHLTGFPNAALREILLERSVLRQATRLGRRARFLNAYRPLFFRLPREQQLRLSATTVANLAADLPFCDLDDVRARRAIYQEFTNRELRERGFDVPELSPAEAGRILATRAREHDFLLFEYFQTDRAGHAQDPARARGELAKLDAFLGAVLADLGGEGEASAALVILTSDHGNLEDLTTRRHTRNPVPLVAWGSRAEAFVREVVDLTGVAPAILRRLAEPPGSDPG